MYLAPDFPDDHAMRQLMELLHEEIGLPERKTIRLDTAINLDLGCDGADARHLMEALKNGSPSSSSTTTPTAIFSLKDLMCFKSAGPRAVGTRRH